MSTTPHYNAKIIIVGDSNVPITEAYITMHHILGRFSRGGVNPTDPLTIEMDVKGQHFAASLFPVSTLPEYDRLRPLAYPRTDLFALTYDPHQPETLESLEPKWLKETRHQMPTSAICVVALQSSTTSSGGPEVTDDAGRALARKIEAQGFLRVDTKDANEVFVKKLLEVLLRKWEEDKRGGKRIKASDNKTSRCTVS